MPHTSSSRSQTHTHNLGWSYLLFSDVCLRHRDHQSGPGCSDPRLASHFRLTKGPLLPSAGAKPLGELNFWLGKAARGIADLGVLLCWQCEANPSDSTQVRIAVESHNVIKMRRDRNHGQAFSHAVTPLPISMLTWKWKFLSGK